MAGGTFSILRSVRGYNIYKEICSQGKFRANKFSRLKFREFEPFAKIAKISPREIFPPYGTPNHRKLLYAAPGLDSLAYNFLPLEWVFGPVYIN